MSLLLIGTILLYLFQLKKHGVYFQEFRKRLIHTLLISALVFSVLYGFQGSIYTILSKPLFKINPTATLVTIDLISPFIIPLKMALMSTILVLIPFYIYQLWAFIKPGLYQQEQKHLLRCMLFAHGLFYGGLAFSYWIAIPIILKCLMQLVPPSIQIMTQINAYFSFIFSVLFATSCLFQTPLVLYIMLKARLCTIEQLHQARPYIVIGIFTIAMLLTPPDVISQILLGLPLWGLFELSLYGSHFVANNLQKKKLKEIESIAQTR